MVLRKDFIQGMVVIVYIAFFAFYAVFARNEPLPPCKKNTCLRFCSENSYEIAPINAVNESNVMPWTATDLTIVVGPCSEFKISENKSVATQNLSIFVIEEKLKVDEYCFEQRDNLSEWNVLTCEKSVTILLNFETVTLCVTLAVFVLTILTYFCINKMNLHEKSVIGFLSSLSTAFIFSRVGFFFHPVIFDAFLATAILWISAVTFDVWWTLNFFHTKSGGKFSTIAAFVAAVLGTMIMSFVAFGVSYFLIISNTLAIVSFIFTAIKIYEFSGLSLDIGRTRLAQQEHRFLLYFQLYIICLMFYLVEVGVRSTDSSSQYIVGAGILHCFNAVLIFAKLILKCIVKSKTIRNICCC